MKKVTSPDSWIITMVIIMIFRNDHSCRPILPLILPNLGAGPQNVLLRILTANNIDMQQHATTGGAQMDGFYQEIKTSTTIVTAVTAVAACSYNAPRLLDRSCVVNYTRGSYLKDQKDLSA